MTDRPGPFGRLRWRVPFEIEVKPDRITWRVSYLDSNIEPEFDRLSMFFYWSRTAADVERFAHLNGLLGICEHDQPFRHGLIDGKLACAPTSTERSGYETLAGWRNVAASARRTLRLSEDVRHDPDNTELQRRLARTVDAWMTVAEVRPVVTGSGIDVAFAGSGLLGDLAVQLLHSVVSTTEFSTCDGCGSIFPVRRRRVAGQRSFCSNCGRSAAQRLASRDYRAANADQVRERDRKRKRRARAQACVRPSA